MVANSKWRGGMIQAYSKCLKPLSKSCQHQKQIERFRAKVDTFGTPASLIIFRCSSLILSFFKARSSFFSSRTSCCTSSFCNFKWSSLASFETPWPTLLTLVSFSSASTSLTGAPWVNDVSFKTPFSARPSAVKFPWLRTGDTMTCVVDFPLREEAVDVLDIDRCHKDRRSHSTLEVNYFTVTHKLLIDEVNDLISSIISDEGQKRYL